MEVLNDENGLAWLRDRGIGGDASTLFFSGMNSTYLQLEIPAKPGGYVHLSRALLRAYDDRPDSYLIWIAERGIWSEINEEVASLAINLILTARDLPLDGRGFLIAESEEHIAVLLTLLMMIFGWEVYIVPFSMKYLCLLSHHGVIEIYTASENDLTLVAERLLPWHPQVV